MKENFVKWYDEGWHTITIGEGKERLQGVKHNQEQWRKCCMCNDMMKVKHNQDQWRKILHSNTMKVSIQSRLVMGMKNLMVKHNQDQWRTCSTVLYNFIAMRRWRLACNHNWLREGFNVKKIIKTNEGKVCVMIWWRLAYNHNWWTEEKLSR